ncbi:uncharacterized protein [Miscanthus floridulus]|uniref:uncharacterized protein n=1 Tax=Miscanthus floridulus TaxID=154761 RepID=UPI003458B56D
MRVGVNGDAHVCEQGTSEIRECQREGEQSSAHRLKKLAPPVPPGAPLVLLGPTVPRLGPTGPRLGPTVPRRRGLLAAARGRTPAGHRREFAALAMEAQPNGPEKFGSSVFAKDGYTNWKKAKDNLNQHGTCKTHNNARLKCDDFMNQRTNVARRIDVISKEEEKRYEIRLNSSLDVARFLIMQGDAFRGHDESSTSNKGTYREMVDWYKDKVEIVKDAYDKGAKNCTMISHHIQKDLTKACAQEVMSVIMDEIRDKKFSILIDESRDVSIKEQMAVILRFVNDEGKVMERLLGLQYVESCTTAALKEALVKMLNSHKLPISRLRGQAIADFFNYVPLIVNTIDASCMGKDTLLAKHHDVLLEKLESGEIITTKAVIDILDIVNKDSVNPRNNGGAFGLIGKMERKDQDIVEAMQLIIDVKEQLQDMRDNGWDPLFKRVKTFCDKNEIEVPDMDKEINARGTSTRRKQKIASNDS